MGLYKKIKDLADSRKISIRQLEEKMNYGNGTIRRWEDSKPSIDKVEKVANFFGVTVDYFLSDDEESPEFFAIQRKSKKLSPKDQKKLLKIMQLTFDDIDNGDFEEDEDDDL